MTNPHKCPVPKRSFTLPVVAVVASLIFFSLTARAGAYIEPVIEQNLPAIAEQVAQGGAVQVPGVSCGSTCGALYQAEQNAGSVTALVEESTGVRQAVGAFPKWSRIGTVSMGGTAFTLGWAIGTGIYKKFLTAEIPAVNPATGYIYDYRNIKAKPCDPSWSSCVGPGSPADAQFYFNTDYYQGSVKKGNKSFVDPSNPYNYWPPIPGPFESYIHEGIGWAGGVIHAFETEGPVQPYVDQPSDRQTPTWPGQPQSGAQLEDALRAALDSGSFGFFQAFEAFKLDPENHPDPGVTAEKEDHRCDRAPGAAYKNPGRNGPEAPFTPYLLGELNVPNRPPGTGAVDVYLRYGETHWIPGRDPSTSPKYIDDWGGWGYRKIKAKHGWSALAEAETREALLDPLPDFNPNSGNWLYESATLETGGAEGTSCFRRVAVDFGPPAGGDPAERGVVTSFNVVIP